VLDNWVAKTANLLVDELDAGPGSRVVLDLPPHWRTVVWLLATWSAGACVVVDDTGPPAEGDPSAERDPPAAGSAPAAGSRQGRDATRIDVLVTADPDGVAAKAWQGVAERVVAVALPALATSFGPSLPPDALDAALEVRSFGDVFVPFVHPTPSDPAYLATSTGGALQPSVLGVPYGELLRFARAEAALSDGVRLLTGGPGTDPLLDLLGPLTENGSVVLHHDPTTLDPATLARLAGQEGVTVTRFRSVP
jgi:non-ribosomal peptide synthetase component F